MTTIAIIKLVSIGLGLLLAGGIAHKLKKGKIAISENKTLKEVNETITTAEKKKNKVREEHNEKADNIINNPNDSHNGLSVTSREHNHSFRSTCTSDCPAFSGK